MVTMPEIAQNVARLRLDKGLTQQQLADKAGISRPALGRIERGIVGPRGRTLSALADALEVPLREIIAEVRPLNSVRFRTRTKLHSREQILAMVSRWLFDYAFLEELLDEHEPFRFKTLRAPDRRKKDPVALARAVRKAADLGDKEPIRSISGLLENNGVKLHLLQTRRDSFLGLSVDEPECGPAIVVNAWDRISVEGWIFTAARELGHLLLHPNEYQRDATESLEQSEREADRFASELLMPEAALESKWEQTHGLPILLRVLKVKRIFHVSYKTVLHRLIESERMPPSITSEFQRQYRIHFNKPLRKADEPSTPEKSEFAWDWHRAGEPDSLSKHDCIETRLPRLVRKAIEGAEITFRRAAEILGMSYMQFRERMREWYY